MHPNPLIIARLQTSNLGMKPAIQRHHDSEQRAQDHAVKDDGAEVAGLRGRCGGTVGERGGVLVFGGRREGRRRFAAVGPGAQAREAGLVEVRRGEAAIQADEAAHENPLIPRARLAPDDDAVAGGEDCVVKLRSLTFAAMVFLHG